MGGPHEEHAVGQVQLDQGLVQVQRRGQRQSAFVADGVGGERELPGGVGGLGWWRDVRGKRR